MPPSGLKNKKKTSNRFLALKEKVGPCHDSKYQHIIYKGSGDIFFLVSYSNFVSCSLVLYQVAISQYKFAGHASPETINLIVGEQ